MRHERYPNGRGNIVGSHSVLFRIRDLNKLEQKIRQICSKKPPILNKNHLHKNKKICYDRSTEGSSLTANLLYKPLRRSG